MNAWNHMMSSHLQEFPRAYALTAKQKRQYRQHQRRYWAILRVAVTGWFHRAWVAWATPARCDRLHICRRQHVRAYL